MKQIQQNIAKYFLAIVTLLFVCYGSIYSQTSIFTSQTPANSGNDSDYELGIIFNSSRSAQITAIRFYKMAGETLPHTATLWSEVGAVLATASFVGETASGWQYAQLSTPFKISAGTNYIASVNINSVYAIEQNQLSSPVTNGFLTAISGGGVFNNTPGQFPASTYNNSNYFVDVVADELNSIFTTQTPAGEYNDGPYEMGVKFTTSQTAKVEMISYYRPASETGSHTGNLWSSSGALLATATFLSESASGWQYAVLNSPVYIYPSNIYVVSVNSNTYYAASAQQALAAPVTNGILSTVADNNNGVFSGSPGTIGVFPTFSFNNVNYFRDIVVVPVYAPAIPVLAEPMNNSTGISIEPVLSWLPSAGATSYSLQVATDASFSNKIINISNLNSTSYSLQGLLNNKDYFWRVSAENQFESSGFSTGNKFHSIVSAEVILSYPIGGESVFSSTPNFSWYLPDGGSGWKYDLLYSTDPAMTAPLAVSNLSLKTAVLSGLEKGTLYYWKIRLKTSGGAVVSYSQKESFVSFGKALIPVPSSPIGNTTIFTFSPTLYWYLNDASTGLTYDIELREGLPGVLTGNPTKTNIANLFTTISGLTSNKQYSWQVRSKSGSAYSGWSAPASFKTVAAAGPVVPTPSWPVNYATVYTTSPTLNWYLGAWISGLTYEIEYVEGLGTPFSGTPTFINISSLSKNLSSLTKGKEYKWRVRSTDGSTYSDWSLAATFKVEGSALIAPVIPVPSWPVGGALVYSSTTRLSWFIGTTAPGLSYEVEYSVSNLTGSPTISGISALGKEITGLIPGATYNWHVRSTDGMQFSAWSATETFKTINNIAAATVPILAWPIGGATVYSNSPTLSWFLNSPSSGLTYELQYATNLSMTGAITITGLTSKNYSLTGLTSGAMYYWKVRSFDGSVYSDYSSIGNFATAVGNTSVVPMIGSPAEGIKIESVSPTLSWFLPTDGEVSSYELEISRNYDMKNANTLEVNSTSAKINGLESGSIYYWRVRSKNSNGVSSDFSSIEKFTAGSATSVYSDQEIPTEFILKQNYPNPFNPATTIEFSVPLAGNYQVKIFNVLGQTVREVANDNFMAGLYKLKFDAGSLSSGIYFYQLLGEKVNIIKKMTLMK